MDTKIILNVGRSELGKETFEGDNTVIGSEDVLEACLPNVNDIGQLTVIIILGSGGTISPLREDTQHIKDTEKSASYVADNRIITTIVIFTLTSMIYIITQNYKRQNQLGQ